ncbi:MAG: D-aminoacylase [Hyphomicrobiaceae bacterium]|nr:D-aminoacylase [Hyphomicrobiaceae bacterium]
MTSKQQDVIIRNAVIFDGTGTSGRTGDLAIKGDRISAIDSSLDLEASEEIDAGGKALAPGFIDAHTHDDRIVLSDPSMACKVSQGVTTVVTGNCGVSIAPVTITERPPGPLDLICPRPSDFYATFADYFSALEASPPSVNVIAQAGHASLRVGVMDRFDRPASDTEIDGMKALLRQALRDGAAGLSTGLYYPPANAAPTEEIEALAMVVKEEGGFHSTHMRDEGDGVVDSLNETFRIGRTADIPVIVSHHKCVGLANHGRSAETLKIIDAARAKQPIGLDVYPYVASSTILQKDRLGISSQTIVTWSDKVEGLEGRDIEEIAGEMGLSIEETVDAISPAGAIYFMMDERDVRAIMSYPPTMIGSDGLPHDRHPHPRLWGTFPRVLGHYCREENLFPLETAVHKMTGLTAKTFGLKDRGVLGEGAYADLVLFDPDEVIDSASFDAPQTPAEGIERVFVNGETVWRDRKSTDARPGRVLRSGLSAARH